MSKKLLVLIIVGLVLNLSFLNSTALASSKEEKLTAKVKSGINKLGIGKDSKVSVKLKDSTKIKGYISEISEDGFTVVDEKTSLEETISFPSVKQVKGNNLSKGAKIAIGIGIAIAVIILIGVLAGGEVDVI